MSHIVSIQTEVRDPVAVRSACELHKLPQPTHGKFKLFTSTATSLDGQLTEEAFVSELGKLVSHLTERLSGSDDGKPKVFRDSAVENLSEFFTRFRQLNVGNNAQLDELVAQAQRVIRGVEPQQLRESTALRQSVATQLSAVQSVLDGLFVDRPRRNIIRSRQPQVA